MNDRLGTGLPTGGTARNAVTIARHAGRILFLHVWAPRMRFEEARKAYDELLASFAPAPPPVFDHLVVTVISPQTAGAAFDVTIRGEDASNNQVDNSTAIVKVSSPSSFMEFDWDGNGTYGDKSGTLTNGLATNTFTVPIYNNFVVTGDRTFDVILTNVTEPGRLMPYGTQTVVIVESNPGFRFSARSSWVSEASDRKPPTASSSTPVKNPYSSAMPIPGEFSSAMV